jgi:hypothetical protein
MSARNIQSILRLAQEEVNRLDGDLHTSNEQVIYLSDKLAKIFHSLRQFNETHGRDLSPDVLDAFNASWRNHEASFDTWQSYQKNDQQIYLDTTLDLE